MNDYPSVKKILCIIGTRPEAIKMAPVISALKKEKLINIRVLVTGQHREMLDQVLKIFGIKPDVDLNLMRPNQDLTTLTAKLLEGLNQVLRVERPDVVLAQGDTTTVMTGALACFYHKIPFGHIEAGLRTWDINSPFPEEMNRVMVGQMANWHFSPTEGAKSNLMLERIAPHKIYVTGNTVIDALYKALDGEIEIPVELDGNKRLLLVTVHRRENFGFRLEQICNALTILLNKNVDLQVLFPVHPNPNIHSYVHRVLGGHPQVILCPPLEYLPFIGAMKLSYLILTDSGGVQEEAPALGKPVLVLRDSTERPEAVEVGVVKLVGTNTEIIVNEVQELLDHDFLYLKMSKGGSPYGDGFASGRIVNVLKSYLNCLPKK
jgi:UDP-N-acetylglucosamine 2-epimerase (non-hydrolysing)